MRLSALVVVASVAVSPSGTRLGKGLGYGELEWGILSDLGVIDTETVVMTTVHDCQAGKSCGVLSPGYIYIMEFCGI